jgi:hypothetical protein
MYLEPILGAPDIQRQLPAEANAFSQVDKQLREIMRRTKDRPNALLAGTVPGKWPAAPSLEATNRASRRLLIWVHSKHPPIATRQHMLRLQGCWTCL